MYLRLTLGVFVIMMTSTVDSVNMTEMMTAFLPVSEHIENEACRRDSLAIVQGVKNLELWALKMVDSSAKLPSGVLQGNIKSLGQYDECVETKSSHFSGQYCLASIRLIPAEGAKQHVTTILDVATLGRRYKEIATNRSSVPVPDILPSLSEVQLGVCVPSSCTPRDVEVTLTEALQHLAKPMGLIAFPEILPGACNVKESIPFDMLDYFMIFLTVVLIFLLIAGTALDLTKTEHTSISVSERALLAFSVPRNWDRIFSPPPEGAFTSLDGLRVISAMFILLNHTAAYTPQEPIANKAYVIKAIKEKIAMPLVNTTLSVDTFFMISAMLRALMLLRDLDSSKFNFFKDAWRRYLRLTPPLAMMVLFYATLLPRISDGPAWYKFVGGPSDACRSNWFYSMIYLNNYSPDHKFCLLQSWYLAADMHFYLLSPILLLATWRWPRRAFHVFLGSGLVTTVAPFIYTFATSAMPTYTIGADDMKMLEYHTEIYLTTHFRASAYIVGLALGYIIYKTDFSKIKLSNLTVVTGWTFSLTLLYYAMFGCYEIMQMDYKYNPIEAALYGALHRPAWALGIAWVVYSCHAGYGGWVNKFLSARIFQILSKLTYSFFLTHFAVVIINRGRVRHARNDGDYELVRRFYVDVVICFTTALVLHLLVEAPALELTKVTTNSKVVKKNCECVENVANSNGKKNE